MNEKILFVDDDPNVLEAYKRKLQRVLAVDTAQSGQEALQCIATKGPYAVVIADMHMPLMNGIEFLSRVKETAPDTVRMMLTGNADIRTAIEAVNEGNIFRFLTKPCPPDIIGKALADAIGQYRLITAEKNLLEDTLNGAVELLVEILSLTDPDGFGQAMQLRSMARMTMRFLNMPKSWDIDLAALLHNIGNVFLARDRVAEDAPLELSAAEAQKIRERAPELAYELLCHIPRLEPVARIIRYQQKNFDGSGFPEDNVSGTDIPIGARILRVLIDLGDLESKGFSKRSALARMQNCRHWYDPRVLDAAIALFLPRESAPRIEAASAEESRLSGLQVGDVLIAGIRTKDNRLLVKEGEVVTASLLAHVRAFAKMAGIQEPVKIKRPSA